MSLITDLVDGVLEGTGWAAGVAIVLGVAAVSSRQGSPLVKNVMKGFLLASDRVKELVAEAGEQMQDLYAEAKAEYEAGGAPLAAAAGTTAAATAAGPGTAPRRRGRPPRAAAEGASAEGGTTTPRRRGRPPRAEGAAGTETTGTAAPRRGRRPRAAGPAAEGGATESA
jgi:hypothetical protein